MRNSIVTRMRIIATAIRNPGGLIVKKKHASRMPIGHVLTQYGLVGLVLLTSAVILFEGCRQDEYAEQPTESFNSSLEFRLKIIAEPAAMSQLKATGLVINAQAVDENNSPVDKPFPPVVISNPSFPVNVRLGVYIPPCQYKITVTLNLSRNPSRTAETLVNVCQSSDFKLSLEAFEEMRIPAGLDPIEAPFSVNAGDQIEVQCGPIPGVSAPDRDRYPIRATLLEQAGESVSDSIDEQTSISRRFPDPHPVVLPSATERVFTCTIEDGRSQSQTYTKVVTRILPTPTPTPTPKPTTAQATCTGTSYAGYCWFYGGGGQNCNTVCASKGLVCDINGISYGASGNCGDIMAALGKPDTDWPVLGVDCGAAGSGCFRLSNGDVGYCATPAATCGANPSPTTSRACACK